MAVVEEDGSFVMAGWEDCILCLQRLGMPPQWLVPQREPGEGLAHTLVPTGAIDGSTSKPTDAHLWVVLFGSGGLMRTTMVAADGHFRFEAIPFGQYWLRVGDDDLDRFRQRPGQEVDLNDFERIAQPHIGATKVTVTAGETSSDVVVPYE